MEDTAPDHISFDLGDPGGITTRFLAKVPGPQMRLGQARMEFTYEASRGTQGLEPYERLLYDAMLGDRTLFTDAEGIESCGRHPVRWSRTPRHCTATPPAPTGRRRCTS